MNNINLPMYRRSEKRTATARQTRRDHLVDAHGRTVHDLRLSVTDRCNFRCVYCMEPDQRFLPGDSILSAAEIERVARVCTVLGVRKIRLTGGEPTVRADLDEIIERLAGLDIDDLAMTTNGSLLTPEGLERWQRLGLNRITVSIDAAEEELFRKLTRSASTVARVMAGVDAARQIGYRETKLNAVLLPGLNENQAVPLARLARTHAVDMRFIEFMPLDGGGQWKKNSFISATQTHDMIHAVYPLRSIGRATKSSTSELYEFADGSAGRIGLVAPVTRKFCGACNRLRISADGSIRPCLFGSTEGDLLGSLRSGASDQQIKNEILDAVWRKQADHGIGTDHFRRPDVAMNTLGG